MMVIPGMVLMPRIQRLYVLEDELPPSGKDCS
jgi:hypothetical protein